MSQGVGVGCMIGMEDKAACNMDHVRYQLKRTGTKSSFRYILLLHNLKILLQK